MKRRLFLLALMVYVLALAVALLFASPTVPTCACTPPPGGLPDYTVADRTNAAEVVLEGTVIALTDADYYPIMKATVKVHQYFKGGSGPVIVTITGFGPSSLCLSWVNVSERWVFYATGNPSTSLEAHYLSQFDAVDPADPQTIAEVIAAVGQDPVLPFGYYVYLPVISVGEPAPYNLKAEDLVLQPSDMPSGYELDTDESGPIEFSDEVLQMGAVDGYENWYTDDSLSSPALVVGNPVIVFRAIHGAQEYIRRVERNCAENPDFKRFIPISIDDEAIACEIYTEEVLFPSTVYAIAFRRGNIVSGIGTGAISSVADFNKALSFARKSLSKINAQIACCSR